MAAPDNFPPSEAGPAQAARAGKSALLGLALSVLALIFFGWIAEEVFRGHAERFDAVVRAAVHGYASPRLTTLMQVFTFVGSPQFVSVAFVLALASFLRAHWRHAAGWLALSVLGAVVLDVTLKAAFHRPRPTPFFGPPPRSFSFPSGHALGALCFYGVLAGLLTARLRPPAARLAIWMATIVLIAAIGFSRIYLGVHYPSDVIAGYCAATVWVGTLVWLDRMRKARK